MDLNNLIANGIFGASGQLLRSVIGLRKAVEVGADFNLQRFMLTLGTGMLLGFLVGMWLSDPRGAFLAGYAGTDFIEGWIRSR